MTKQLQAALDAAMTHLSGVSCLEDAEESMSELYETWKAEKETLRLKASVRATRLAKEGKINGRPKLELPTAEWMRKRLQVIGMNKLAKELGVDPSTVRARLKEDAVPQLVDSIEQANSVIVVVGRKK